MITIKKIFSKPTKTIHKLNVGKFSTELLTIKGLTHEQQLEIHKVFYNNVK
tara:strand:- start:1420 stop:1572 length:153 start_codon:yes stop_codon:yes gene_type:complete